jgi:hypothetical protein
VTSGALAAFTFVPIGKYIKIMVADPTAHDGLVQVVVKPHLGPLVLTELSAFQVHDPFQGFFLLGPYYRCRHDSSNNQNNQNKNETQLLHMFLPDHLYTNFEATLREIGFCPKPS